MLAVVSGCSCEANAVKIAVDIVLWRTYIKRPSEGRLFVDIVWEHKEMMCKAGERDKFVSVVVRLQKRTCLVSRTRNR